MGKKSSNKQTTTSDSSQKSWLMDIPGLQDMANNLVSNSTNLPDYVYEGLNETQMNALNQLISGRDQSTIQGQSDYLNDQSIKFSSAGLNQANDAANTFNKYANMSNADYNQMISDATNSGLVNTQKEISTRNIQKALDKNVNQLNQAASGTGNMGSSRAGVAQGVMTSEALTAIGDANAAIDQNAYQNAINSVNNQIGSSLSAAGQLSSQGLNFSQMGMSGLNSSMGWNNTINDNVIKDLNNMFNAGSIFQTNSQNQANNAWQNQVKNDNPYLSQWQQIVNALGPAAGWSTTGTQTSTAKTSGGGSNWMSGLTGLAGAGIGGYFGGSTGATAGAGIGSSLGSMFN